MTNSRPPRSHKFGTIAVHHIIMGDHIMCAQCNEKSLKLEWNTLNRLNNDRLKEHNMMRCPKCNALGQVASPSPSGRIRKEIIKKWVANPGKRVPKENKPRHIDLQWDNTQAVDQSVQDLLDYEDEKNNNNAPGTFFPQRTIKDKENKWVWDKPDRLAVAHIRKSLSELKNQGFDELMENPEFRMAQNRVKKGEVKLGYVSDEIGRYNDNIGGADEQKESDVAPANPKSPTHPHPNNAWQVRGHQ